LRNADQLLSIELLRVCGCFYFVSADELEVTSLDADEVEVVSFDAYELVGGAGNNRGRLGGGKARIGTGAGN
jgi:hypothetical protein